MSRLEYTFHCPYCEKDVSMFDWCGIRDHAIEHMTKCRPAQIEIMQIDPVGEIISVIVFKEESE